MPHKRISSPLSLTLSLRPRAQLEMELHVGGELKQILTGKFTLPELSNDDLDDAKLPGGHKCTCEQDGWKPFFESSAKCSWGAIKTTLQALIEQAKQKWA